MKRILFFNAKREKCDARNPHLGLAMLAAVLKNAGHQVSVIDYKFYYNAPPVIDSIKEFKPDIIGISLNTSTMKEADKIIDIASRFNIPLLAGGSHASLYSEELANDNRIDYIVKGEAEEIICNLIEEARPQEYPKIIGSVLPDPAKLPHPDFTSFSGCDTIVDYPLLVSRGCPYNCSFCAIHLVSSKQWRPRLPADCIDELKEAKKKFIHLKKVGIFADSPMFNPRYIKELLRLYIEEQINLPLVILNTRADNLDEEIISLLKECGCPSIALGVEHGHPDVFSRINKGETLERIKEMAKLIKRNGMGLYLTFIIGLPGDSLEKTKSSIKLAKELDTDLAMWNFCLPFKGTQIRRIFQDSRAKLLDVTNHAPWLDGDFVCDEPSVETPEFSIEEQKKAYYMAILETGHPCLDWKVLPRLIPYVVRYGLYLSFFYWLYNRLKRSRLKRFSKIFISAYAKS